MKSSINALCAKFIENRDIIKSAMPMESGYIYPVCSVIFTGRSRRADVERLKLCRDLIKKKTGTFSSFRGVVRPALVSMMAVDADPAGKLEKAQQIYDMLKRQFRGSQYLPVAAMMITELTAQENYAAVVQRAYEIYKKMKEEHPLLTSSEDSGFAVLLAFSDKSDEQIIEELETCYKILKKEFFSGNAVQTLSHVLALSEGRAEDKCQKVMELYDALEEKKLRYGKDHMLATLGALAMLPCSVSELVENIAQADEYLSGQKGYGFFGVGKRHRLMHAGMIAACDNIEGNSIVTVAGVDSAIAITAAQQAAMCAALAAQQAALCAAIAASAAAANAASSASV